jgi:hypothetical protein
MIAVVSCHRGKSALQRARRRVTPGTGQPDGSGHRNRPPLLLPPICKKRNLGEEGRNFSCLPATNKLFGTGIRGEIPPACRELIGFSEGMREGVRVKRRCKRPPAWTATATARQPPPGARSCRGNPYGRWLLATWIVRSAASGRLHEA